MTARSSILALPETAGVINLIMGFFFFNDTATTEIYTLSLHDALPICMAFAVQARDEMPQRLAQLHVHAGRGLVQHRSEEHTSELQSRPHLVCRLLLEKKKGQPAGRTLRLDWARRRIRRRDETADCYVC